MDDLAERALVDEALYFVPIAKLLADLHLVEAVRISDLVLVLPPHAAQRVNALVVAQFDLLELSQTQLVGNFQHLLRRPADPVR